MITLNEGNEKGQGNLEAFQVSDQALKLHQTNNFIPSEDPSKLQFRTPVYVEGAQTTVADYHFFLVTVTSPLIPHSQSYIWCLGPSKVKG